MAEIIYGAAAINGRETYTAFADVNQEYVLGKVKELEGLTLTWEEFEERWEQVRGDYFDDMSEKDQATLVELYGERAVQLEIVSDTAEEDEERILAWMRKLLTEEKWCGISDWDDSPLPWNRTGLALDRLVKKGRLVKDRDDAYLVPHDREISLKGVLCDGCADDFGWFGALKLHRECLQALIVALQAANEQE